MYATEYPSATRSDLRYYKPRKVNYTYNEFTSVEAYIN